ncbi:hypothetical protein V8E53_012185 [Lactarius tabidus]
MLRVWKDFQLAHSTKPDGALHIPVYIALAILEAGYHQQDSHRDTGFLPSAALVVSLFPNLSEPDITFYPTPKPIQSNEREGEPFVDLDDEALSILRSGPRITALHLANWSNEMTLLGALLSLYHNNSTLRTLSLRGTPASFSVSSRSPSLSALPQLNLTLEPSLALVPAPHGLVHGPQQPPLVRALDTLTRLALPTLTVADADNVAGHGCPRIEALRTEHPHTALPPRLLSVRRYHVALARVHDEARARGCLETVSSCGAEMRNEDTAYLRRFVRRRSRNTRLTTSGITELRLSDGCQDSRN